MVAGAYEVSHEIREKSHRLPSDAPGLIQKEKVEIEGNRITVGKTSVQLAEIAEELDRYRELLQEIIADEWYERRLQQVAPLLTPFPQAHQLSEWDRQNLERYHPVFLMGAASESRGGKTKYSAEIEEG